MRFYCGEVSLGSPSTLAIRQALSYLLFEIEITSWHSKCERRRVMLKQLIGVDNESSDYLSGSHLLVKIR